MNILNLKIKELKSAKYGCHPQSVTCHPQIITCQTVITFPNFHLELKEKFL